ncbi:DUF4390 domain-containing protein [Granulosicoccaceae sp. 1_MG-2023]|nr:DUF4390 domain-containing protein [Granulosicoccaceae sp. 1_MG-2023]
MTPHRLPTSTQTGRRPVRYRLVLCLALCLPLLAMAAERVWFENVRVYRPGDYYLLDLDSHLRLRARPTEALANGVSLYFDLTIEVKRQRNLWPDETVRTITKRYRLFYFELTRHFRVTETRSGHSSNFDSLDKALDYLGNLRAEPLVAARDVDMPQRYRVEIQLAIDPSELPAPLQIQAYTTRRYLMKSDVLVWPLD